MSGATVFKWPINNLMSAFDLNRQINSPIFTLKDHPSASFALFLHGRKLWNNSDLSNSVSMSLSATSVDGINQLEFRVKLWLENELGGVFNMQITENMTFKTIDTGCKLNLGAFGKSSILNTYLAQQRLSFCCEIKCVEEQGPPPAKKLSPSAPLGQKMWELYLDQHDCDATILVEEKEFKIHRNVFAAQSDVFRTMFASDFEEGLSKLVEIKDFSIPSMEALVRWFYLGDIEDKSAIEDLFALADLYMIEDLKSQTSWYMLHDLDEDNAALRLSLAIAHKSDALKDHILVFIKQLGPEKHLQVIESEEWRNYLNNKQAMSENS